MKKRKLLFFIAQSVLCALPILVCDGQKIFSQDECKKTPAIEFSQVDEGDDQIVVVFDAKTDFTVQHAALVAEIQKQQNWIVFSQSLLEKARSIGDLRERAAVYESATPEIASVTTSGAKGVVISVIPALNKDETYMVNFTQKNSVVSSKCVGAPVSIKVIKPVQPTPPNSQQDEPEKKVVFNEVEKREQAELYVEGNLEGAHKKKTAFTIDASIGKEFRFKKTNLNDTWKPFFNIKASTNEKADPDSLSFGVKFERKSRIYDGKLLGIQQMYYSATPKFEADRDFENFNFVGDFRTRFVSSYLAIGTINIVPFVGFEIGKNLRSPVAEIEGKPIARPLFGARLYFPIYTGNKEGGYQKTAAFETFYERRFPLQKELALDKDKDNNFVGVTIGRAPRDYAKSSLIYNFSKNFGFTLNYEYGSLPPLFKLVDSKFSLGFVFKGKFDEEKR